MLISLVELSCPSGSEQYKGNCYRIIDNQNVYWSGAYHICKDYYDSGLAIIRSKEDMEFIENLVRSSGKSIWIALKTNGSGLEWVTKDEFNHIPHTYIYSRCIIARPVENTIYWELVPCQLSTTAYPLCQEGIFIKAFNKIE